MHDWRGWLIRERVTVAVAIVAAATGAGSTALALPAPSSPHVVSMPAAGWATARSRFDIDATAGVSRLTVIRW